MIYLDPWLFLLLCLSAAGGYMAAFLYVAHWWIHKRVPKAKPEPEVIYGMRGEVFPVTKPKA